MKRGELQALCKRHGLHAGGTNADLVARLTATLSGSGGAAEEAVGVVVGKGCLKRSAGGASGGDLDAAKKVTFELEEDAEAEVAVTGRGRRRSLALSSPAVAKTRGRPKAGEAPAASKGNGGERGRTRSQAGGDSADESDSGEAGADAPVRRSGRNAVNLDSGDVAERVAGAVITRKNLAKAGLEDVDVGDAVGRKHQLKRKTRENDSEDVDVSGHVGVSRRSTRTSSLLLEPDTLSSPVEKKRGRRKAADVKEKTCVEEQPTEALRPGRTLRSGVVVVAPVPPIVSESKKSRWKVQEEEPAVEEMPKVEISGKATRSSSVAPAVEKVAKVEISGRATRSSSVASAVTSPRIIAKKRGRKTEDVHSDGGQDEKMENKRQSSILTTCSSIHHLASSGDEASLEQVAAPSKGLPPRRSGRNPSEANMMLNSNTTSQSSNLNRIPTEFNGPKIARPTMLNAAKDGVEDGVEKLDRHVGLKKSKLRNVSATVATNGGEIPFSDSSGKASATNMRIEVPGPVRRSTRKSVVPSSLEHKTNGMHEDVEKKQTVTKPVGRSTRRSVAPVILEKESKGLTKEIFPEAHLKRPTRKSVVPAMIEKGRKSIITEIIPEARVKRSTRKPALPMVNSDNNDHCVVVSSENLQSDKSEELEKQPTIKQPVRRVTRKSAVPAMPEKDRKGVPDMLNNDNSDRTEMQSDKVGHLEKQLVVKEPVRRPTGKSVVPDVIEKEKTGLHEELKSEVSVRTPVSKSGDPNAVNKNNKDHNDFVRREELSVKTRSAHTILQVALQNDESLRRTTRNSSKLAISQPQSKPTASKGRPAKRRRTSSLQEDMPAEEQKEDQIAYGAHTNDVTEVATSTGLEIGVLPFAAEKTDLRDSQLNSELEGMVVVEPVLGRDEDNSDRLEVESEGTVGTTEKPPSNLPIPDCKDVVAFSEEAVHSIENDAGRCSPNFEQEVSSCQKDLVVSAQLDLSQDADHVVRDVITEDLICKEEEKKDFIPSSDISVPHEIAPANEPAENASGVSGAVFCISQRTPISDEVNSDLSRLESPDALDYRIASSNTEVVQQDNEEECNLHNVVTQSIHASGMSEASQVKVSKSEKMLLPDVETSVFRDAQLNRKREGNEFEEHSFSCGKDESRKNNMSPLANKYVMDSCQEQEVKLPHDLSAVKSLKGSTTCQDEFVIRSGIGRTSGSMVKGNDIAMDTPSTAKQGDKLSPSATTLLRNREDAPACKIDAPELSSDHLFVMDLSARTVQSVSGRLWEAGLAVGNSDNKIRMEQVQQDDVQVLEGTLENTVLGSATPESNQQCGLSEEAEPHSLKNTRCSSTVEQSPFGLQSLFLQNDLQVQKGTLEKTALVSATPPVCKHEYGLPDKAEPHSLKNAICSSSVEHSPFGLQSLFSLDDLHVEEGTLEKATLGSATPECKHECGLPHDAESHSFKKICSSSVEQSPFGLQSLFSQDGTLEKAALGSATPECKHESGLPDEVESHILKNEICSYSRKNEMCSSSVERSPFGLQSLFLQDDVHVQEGTLEKAALDSVTPDGKHECGLPDEAEPHSSKNERCSTSVEQSPFGLQLLFSQESEEEPSENVALAVHAKNGVDESKDIHVGYGVEKPPLPESVSDHDSNVDFSAVSKSEDCAYTSDQGLTKSCHEQEQMECQLDKLEAANCMKDFTNPEEVSYIEENKKPVHSTEINSSCEKIDANGPVKHSSGLGDGLLSSSLIASTDDTDVHPSSNRYQFESTDFLDELKGCSSTEALQQGLKEQCDEPNENQVTDEVCPSDMIEVDTAEDLETEVPPFPAEETSNMPEYLFLRESSKGSDMHGDLVLPSAENEDDSNTCHVELQAKKMVSSELDASKGSDIQDDPVLPGAENENDSISCHVEQQVEKVVSSEHDSHQGSHEDLTIVEGITGCMFSSQLEHEKDEQLIVPLLAEETSTLLDEQANPELEAGEFEKCNHSSEDTSGKIGTGYVNNNLFQLHEDSHMDPIQSNELPNDLPAPKSPAQFRIGQDAEISALLEKQPNPELDSVVFEERNLRSEDTSDIFGTGDVETNLLELHEDSHMDTIQGKEPPNDLPAPKSPEQSTIGQDTETSALLDEQLNPELKGDVFKECNISSEDTIFGTGYVNANLFQLHEDSQMDHIQGKELPKEELPAPKSPDKSTTGQDAETSAWQDEQLNPVVEAGEFEERNFSSEDTSGIFGTGYAEDKLFQFHEYSHMDPIQGKVLPNHLPAPKSPKQSTIGQDENVSRSETSPLPDEKFDPKLEGEEFEEHNHIRDKAASYIFSCGSVKNNTCHWDDKEEYNEHNDDQAAAAMLSSGMTKPTLIQGSESGMALLSAAGTPALTDEQLNSKLEGNEEHSLCFDVDNSYISDTGLMETNNLSSLPEDTCMETCFERELPIGTPAAKSSGESVVFGDNIVPGSVGTCQTSRRRRIEEISTKLLSFKISSAVKGSYIAMDSANTMQGDTPSPISFLGNTENVPAANPDHSAELNTDWLDVKDSPRQGTNDGL